MSKPTPARREAFEIFEFLLNKGVDTASINFHYSEYREGEKNILTPLLKEHGVTIYKWWTSEGDSFGPLIRACEGVDSEGLWRGFYG